ncbi:ribosomal protein S2 [Edhazardia aedis USNM 41457]|uniref:Small ribosomal subunit protein uS2 n=1 Tax=Edhazardia aedis (strain USNM 41457) TaxID=1003232 RepID=J8ZY30_EDHAE|nr:ribosomal protein S2 [Edhazardia aedis USNM 41457]|eukprot:EJW04543.1 ribosomal protein S2 [Edhazardia aedis USNM 41457]
MTKKFRIDFPAEFQQALIRCYCHLGGKKVTRQCENYVYAVRPEDGIHIIDINLQWEKIILAARAICAIPNPQDIIVCSSREYGRKAVLRFCEYTGCTPYVGRFIPGMFTNPQIRKIKEPRLVVVADPFTDKQTVYEAGFVNTPCVAFCNTDNDLDYVDIAIPMNNRSLNAIGAGFCILAKVVKFMRGEAGLTDNLKFEIERYFYRNIAELEELAAEQEASKMKQEVDFVEPKENVVQEGEEQAAWG